MARPKENKADYFPHYANQEQSLQYLQGIWGNDGYAIYFKLLEKLAAVENHCILYPTDPMMIYLFVKHFFPNVQLDEDNQHDIDKQLISIFNKMADLKIIDKSLWHNHKIIWSQYLISQIEDLYTKTRRRPAPTKEDAIRNLDLPENLITGISTEDNDIKQVSNTVNTGLNAINTVETPQRKVKENNMEKESKVANFSLPPLKDVTNYFLENGYSEQSADLFLKHYEPTWPLDTKGNPIKDWRSKAQKIWFKPENKIQVQGCNQPMVYKMGKTLSELDAEREANGEI